MSCCQHSDPENWRLESIDGISEEDLSHGNLVTINGTWQIMFKYVGPEH